MLGFMKCFAKFQKLGLKASNSLEFFNSQHFMNLFPKVAKIARKRLFTNFSKFELQIQTNVHF